LKSEKLSGGKKKNRSRAASLIGGEPKGEEKFVKPTKKRFDERKRKSFGALLRGKKKAPAEK